MDWAASFAVVDLLIIVYIFWTARLVIISARMLMGLLFLSFFPFFYMVNTFGACGEHFNIAASKEFGMIILKFEKKIGCSFR